MGMGVDYIAGKQAIKELEKLFSDQEHGEREEIADDIIEFVEKMKVMEPIENCVYGYDPTKNGIRKISDMDFAIPPDFLHVVNTMHPELNLIEIHSVETYSMIDATSLTTHEYFRVKLNIQIANGSYPIGAMTQYGDSITNLFRYTYNDYAFVSFQIHEMKHEPTVSNRDKFMELFGAAK